MTSSRRPTISNDRLNALIEQATFDCYNEDEQVTGLFTMIEDRADDIATVLLDRLATPFEIAHRLQWQPEGARLLVGLAHVQGHLDLLEEAGRATAATAGAAVRYELRV